MLRTEQSICSENISGAMTCDVNFERWTHKSVELMVVVFPQIDVFMFNYLKIKSGTKLFNEFDLTVY